jgi:enoyl-CoA hydratase/carnithine racemase
VDVVVVQSRQKLATSRVDHFLTRQPSQSRGHVGDAAVGESDVGRPIQTLDLGPTDQKRRRPGAGIHGPQVTLAFMGDPMVVVDLDDTTSEDRVPNRCSSVVVGVSRAGEPPSLAGREVDVALTSTVGSPAPWVASPDVDQELELLVDQIRERPLAAVTLVHVLRSSDGLSIPKGLLVESLAYSALQSGPEFRTWLDARPTMTPKAEKGDPVLVARDGHRLTIALNRPEVHNAYNASMRDALCDALSIAAADPSVEEVRLLGAGRSFCSGGDLSEFGTFTDPVRAHLIRTSHSPARLLGCLADRVTAHVHGSCVGSGIEIPTFAATVLADPASTFRLPEVAMGLIPGAGGTVSIPRRIGRRRAGWLALSGRPIDAATAQAWGLVDGLRPRILGPIPPR